MSTKKIQILGEINKKQIIAQDTAPDDTNALWIDTSDNTGDVSVVVYDTAQDLTDEQKAQARENIGASSMSDVQTHIEDVNAHVTVEEKNAWNAKQDTLSGTAGQIVEFDANGKAIARNMPTASEIGALPNTTSIPSKISQLTNDSGYLTSINQNTVTVSAATDYTTNRVRGIALYQDTASDTIPNGCICGVYTIE